MSLFSVAQNYLSLALWVRLPLMVFIFFIVLVSIQNFLIFPAAVLSIFKGSERDNATLPADVESIFVDTSDGEKLEVWRLGLSQKAPVAVIFHGNGGDVENFLPYQKYFQSLGITSYGFDYRGYGRSSGWPSEEGLYTDAKAVVDYVLSRESLSNKELIVVGISVGTGPASYAAAEFDPGALVLVSPFISLSEAIKSRPLIGILHTFAFYDFPVKQHVGKLVETCLVVAHGEKDNVIPFSQGQAVFKNYHGRKFSAFIDSSEASHNDILFKSYPRVTKALRSCFSDVSTISGVDQPDS